MTYADFQSILVPKDNGKQDSNEPCTNNYQKCVACSYGYKLICVDDKLNNAFKLYLGNGAVYNFIISIIEESRYCSDMMKNYFNKIMRIKDNEYFESSTTFGFVIMIIFMVMLK